MKMCTLLALILLLVLAVQVRAGRDPVMLSDGQQEPCGLEDKPVLPATGTKHFPIGLLKSSSRHMATDHGGHGAGTRALKEVTVEVPGMSHTYLAACSSLITSDRSASSLVHFKSWALHEQQATLLLTPGLAVGLSLTVPAPGPAVSVTVGGHSVDVTAPKNTSVSVVG